MMLIKLIIWIIIFWLLYSLVKRTVKQLFSENSASESNVKGRKPNTEKLYDADDIVDVKFEEVPEEKVKKDSEVDD